MTDNPEPEANADFRQNSSNFAFDIDQWQTVIMYDAVRCTVKILVEQLGQQTSVATPRRSPSRRSIVVSSAQSLRWRAGNRGVSVWCFRYFRRFLVRFENDSHHVLVGIKISHRLEAILRKSARVQNLQKVTRNVSNN